MNRAERLSAERAPLDAFAADVRSGLGRRGQKQLSPRWFYDETGSALFEAICRMPEYGLTRADERLLNVAAADIALRAGRPPVVIELGSGTGRKTRRLIDALASGRQLHYHPVDVSVSALETCAREVGAVAGVTVEPHEGEFLDGLRDAVATRPPDSRLLVLFLGGTIGNFERADAERFLRRVRSALKPGDTLLIGTDLVKPVGRLLAAYDDATGITAAFNRNVLGRMNRELGANFDLSLFRHAVRWDESARRIEMHLASEVAQPVSIPGAGLTVSFRPGETIWTENSYKYEEDEATEIGARNGWQGAGRWIDREWPFAETLLVAD